MRRDEAVAELRGLPLRQNALQSLELRVRSAELALEALPENLRLVLVGSYIKPVPLERLMEELGVEKSRVYQLRSAALRAFCLAAEGAAEVEF